MESKNTSLELFMSPQSSENFVMADLSRSSSWLICGTEQLCSSCCRVMKDIECDDTKQFWIEMNEEGPIENEKCHFKFFETFMKRLRDNFPNEDGLRKKTVVNLLKRLLDIDTKDETAGIKLTNFTRLTRLFGPIRTEENHCVLIDQLHQVIKSSITESEKMIKVSWFVGEMSRDEAEQWLLADDCRVNTFLVRISESDGGKGDFVLSVRHNSHCHHLKIEGNPKEALATKPYDARLHFGSKSFPSLVQLFKYTKGRTIEIDVTDNNGETGCCTSVNCFRVFTKSPLNSAISEYEIAK